MDRIKRVAEGRVLGLERKIRFSLDEGSRYAFKGVIDRLMLAPDGAFEIHDYKTGAGLPVQADLDKDRQLVLYQIGVQKLWPEAREVRLVWMMKEPKKNIVSGARDG